MKLDQAVIDTLKKSKSTATKPECQNWNGRCAAVNKALECLGGKWNKGAQAHVWDCDPGDPLAHAVMVGEVRDWKKELQFFPTPKPLAHWMVTQAELRPGLRILEPSAGTGAIVQAIYEATPLSNWPQLKVTAVEVNPTHAKKLKEFAQDIRCADFLSLNGDLGEFDRVLMNPPFSGGQDIDHIRHAWSHLKPGGRLVAIASPGWTFRTNTKHAGVRDWLNEISAVWREVPAGTFSASGTEIRTVSIVMQK